jgi:hypothetical protein
MKKLVLWILFFIFLALIISPVDLLPGPLDDIIYGIFDVVIVAILGSLRQRKKTEAIPERAAPPKEVPEIKES